MDPVLAELIDGFNKAPPEGSPGPLRSSKAQMIRSTLGPCLNVDWLPDKERASVTYEVYLLMSVYDNGSNDTYVAFKKVWGGPCQQTCIQPHVLEGAAVYIDPKQDSYHLLVVGRNSKGMGKPHYIGVGI